MRASLLIPALILLGACSTQEVRVAHSIPLATPEAAYAESDLLDVGVVIFEAGVPDGELTREQIDELMNDGTFVQIRRAESMYLAVKLRETLERSRHWGSVWVVPRESTALDVNVYATIGQSDGNVFELRASAVDATGQVWFERKYSMETAAIAFNTQKYPTLDPYQDVFNELANDLAAYRASLDAGTIARIREIGELRYASELSPDAFGDYLERSNSGVFEPVRLPAAGDPMLGRARSVRQQEQVFFETLDQSYENFAVDAKESYAGWREYSREDSIRLQEAARAAKLRTTWGALAIALSIGYGMQSDSNSFTDLMVSEAGIYIGNDLLRSASTRRQERRLHIQSLQELSEDFDDTVKPLVVDVQGTQHRLTGSVEAQLEDWKSLMREFYISETGIEPEEIQVFVEPDPLPEETAPADGEAVPEGGSGDPSQAAPAADGTSPAETGAPPNAGGASPAAAGTPPAAAGATPTAASPKYQDATADGNGGQPADA